MSLENAVHKQLRLTNLPVVTRLASFHHQKQSPCLIRGHASCRLTSPGWASRFAVPALSELWRYVVRWPSLDPQWATLWSDISSFLFRAELPFSCAAAQFENWYRITCIIKFWAVFILYMLHHSPISSLRFLFHVTVTADFCFVFKFELSLIFLQSL